MPEKNNTTAVEPLMVPVLVRLTREELDFLRRETGANADATAVACFVRKSKADKEG